MKVIHFIFAPFFWLRDIRDSLKQIRRILLAQSIVGVKFSPASPETRKLLVAFMLLDHEREAGKGIKGNLDAAASLLRSLKFNN